MRHDRGGPRDFRGGGLAGSLLQDPDGNEFSALWMDPVAAEMGPEAHAAPQKTDA